MAVVNMEHPEKGDAIVEDWDVGRMESHGFKLKTDKPKRRRRTTPKPPDSEQED